MWLNEVEVSVTRTLKRQSVRCMSLIANVNANSLYLGNVTLSLERTCVDIRINLAIMTTITTMGIMELTNALTLMMIENLGTSMEGGVSALTARMQPTTDQNTYTIGAVIVFTQVAVQ